MPGSNWLGARSNEASRLRRSAQAHPTTCRPIAKPGCIEKWHDGIRGRLQQVHMIERMDAEKFQRGARCLELVRHIEVETQPWTVS